VVIVGVVLVFCDVVFEENFCVMWFVGGFFIFGVFGFGYNVVVVEMCMFEG